MMRTLLVAALALACNSPPSNSCIPQGHSLGSASTSPSTCSGVCASLVISVDAGGDGGAYEVCAVDCTDAGNAVCEQGFTTCVSGAPITTHSYCLLTCGDDAGTCPSPLYCADGGYCL